MLGGTGENQVWCGGKDSNLHGIATASPSSWCVCQFRHHRILTDLESSPLDAEGASSNSHFPSFHRKSNRKSTPPGGSQIFRDYGFLFAGGCVAGAEDVGAGCVAGAAGCPVDGVVAGAVGAAGLVGAGLARS